MFKFLLNTEQNQFIYIIKAWILVYFVATVVSKLIYISFPNVQFPNFENTATFVIGALVWAPIIETLVMILIFKIINCFTQSLIYTCLASAFTWAVMHSLSFPIHGVIIFYSFFVFSLAYKVWEKVSKKKAFFITAAIHFLNNLTAVLLFKYN